MSLPLTAMVQNAALLGFELAGEIVVEHVYVQHNAVNYDPANGGVPAGNTLNAMVDAIVSQYSQKETDGQKIRVGDEKLLVKAAELNSIVPVVDDFLGVLGSNVVPALAAYLFIEGVTSGYTLEDLIPGDMYYFTANDNNGRVFNDPPGTLILDGAGFFIAPASGIVTLIYEGSPAPVTATVQPLNLKRLIVDIKRDPTGTLYTFQTRKAQT